MKRICSVLLVLLLCVSVLPLKTQAAETAASGTCGDGLTWILDSDGTLTISGEGMMDDYDYASRPWAGLQGVQRIVIEQGVTKIGDYAFGSMFELNSILIPDSVTWIGDGAFCWSKLTEITLSPNIRHIGVDALGGCSDLTCIKVASENPNYSSDENGALYNKDKTRLIRVPGGYCGEFNIPDSVKTLDYRCFSYCWQVTGISIPEGVQEIREGAFTECSNLEELSIPASIEVIASSPFFNCASLRGIWVDENNNFFSSDETGVLYSKDKKTLCQVPCGFEGSYIVSDTVNHIDFGGFTSCRKLTSITIPDSVTTISSAAFQQCTALEEIKLSNNIASIESSMFLNCYSLKEITIPRSVNRMEANVFVACDGLEAVYFTGNAPSFDEMVFSEVSTTAYYPANDLSWSADIMQDYGGTVIWMPYCAEHEPVAQNAVVATCEEEGYSGDAYCEICGELISQGSVVEPLGHNYVSGICGHCGVHEPDRLYGSNRYATAFNTADRLKQTLNIETFDAIVVACGKDFPDALAGSYLAAQKNAPILLVNQYTVPDVANYIAENLSANGIVYLLGGEAAVPAEMETALAGYNVKRLSGSNRYATNLLILNEIGTLGQEILVCTGTGFADSLSASAVNKPILLVNRRLTEDQKTFLSHSSGRFVIIGGTSAVSEELEAELSAYGSVERLGGSNRYETSVLVAKRFFSRPTSMVLAYAQNFPDGLCGGPLAATMNAPLILTATNREATASAYASENGITSGVVLGGSGLIADSTVDTILKP